MITRTTLALALTAGALAAPLAVASPASAATTCYGQAQQRLDTGHRMVTEPYWGTHWRSAASFVTYQSPCRDINVRDVRDARTGQPTCTAMRVRFTAMPTAPSRWTTVCSGWSVLFSNATEELVFTVESRKPVTVVVRT